MNAFSVVNQFEERVAEYSGSKYGVAVDSCTMGIFLCAKYLNTEDTVVCPARTYVSVPMYLKHAGYKVVFEDFDWTGTYQLKPLNIIDGAKRFRKNMYQGGFHCLSFHIKKPLPIGRGGMILTDDEKAVKWLRKARYDGREGKPYDQEKVETMGWHCYMTPEQAARGLLLMDTYKDLPDQTEDYPDLREMPVFK